MYLLGLEIVQGAFLAPCLGQEVPTKRNFGLKWLLALKGTPQKSLKIRDFNCICPNSAFADFIEESAA